MNRLRPIPPGVLSVCILSSAINPIAASAAPPAKHDPQGLFRVLDEIPAARTAEEAWVRPDRFVALELDMAALRDVLRSAPLESQVSAPESPFIMWLPLADGVFEQFRVVESPIMEPALARQFPEVKTYLGQGLDSPARTVRFDVTPQGFHSQVLGPGGRCYVDPYSRGDDTIYSCYWMNDAGRRDLPGCQGPVDVEDYVPPAGPAPRASGTQLRTYRLACAATGEYTAFHGGTVPLGQAAIVTAVNRVSGVYENDVAVRLMLIGNNSLLVYTDPNTDPYTNGSGSAMLGENQTNINAVIGSANYDIGHVFSTGGGGIASLGVVCGSSKARGVTGLSAPIGDGFYIDYVAHEMGHQFGAQHSFNGNTTNCGTNRSASSAYEVGSGSTVMSYAGVCGSQDNLQAHSDAYFHSVSYDQILSFISSGGGSGCPAVTLTGNTPPTAEAGPNYTVPTETPFILTASGSDANGDTLTYTWEERDLGPAMPGSGSGFVDNGTSPIWRCWAPVTDPFRYFQRLQAMLANNAFPKGERTATTNRNLNFRVMVRDNRAGGGGVEWDTMLVTVVNVGGPFMVTSPNTNVSWSGQQTVTWSVSGTTGPPVNCPTVNILLSTDGGNNFTTVLASNTANDGSELVTLPNVASATARIKVESVGNIFFDISNVNFTLTAAPPPPPTNAEADPQVVCVNGQTNLSAVVGSGIDVDWYSTGCGSGFVGTGNPLAVFPTGNTTYHARARDLSSGLSSLSCDSVSVTAVVAGDADANGLVNEADIDPLVTLILSAPAGLACAADVDGDGDADGSDVAAFVAQLVP